MNFEQILKEIGGWGKYQKALFLALALVGFPNAFHSLVQTFIGFKPPFICLTRYNATYREFLSNNRDEVVFPENEDEECYFMVNDTIKQHCDSYLFDQSQFTSTIVTHWNLVCERKYLAEIDTSMFMAGKLVGAFLLGIASDVLGRRKIFFFSIYLMVFSGLLAFWSTWYTMYLGARLIAGIANSGTTLSGYILALELVDAEHRPIPGILWHLINSLGNFVLLLFTYTIREWDSLILVITLPCLSFLLYWKNLPESPRWLLMQGRHIEAKEIIMKAASVNGKEDAKIEFDEDLCMHKIKPSIITEAKLLLSSWYLFRSTLIIWGCWMCLSGAYYGLSLNAKHMSGDIYLNYFYISLVEVIAIMLLALIANKMPRKTLLGSMMLLGGISCLMVLFFPAWSMIISLTGKFFITGAYSFSYLISVELFPTSIRNVGLGVSSVMARVGGILCPYVLITKDLWEPMPLIIFGGSTLIIGVMTYFLRETESGLTETTTGTKSSCKDKLLQQ